LDANGLVHGPALRLAGERRNRGCNARDGAIASAIRKCHLKTTLQYAGVNIITVPLSIAHGTFYEYTALGITTAGVYIYMKYRM
jgi:hypothetical protein